MSNLSAIFTDVLNNETNEILFENSLKRYTIKNESYSTLKQIADEYNVSSVTVNIRIKSDKYPDWIDNKCSMVI
jgi:hypothetical protein